MKRDKLLIISSKDDPHTDFVINKINESGKNKRVIRFNTEDFISNCEFTYHSSYSNLHFLDSQVTLKTEELYSVWYRRPKELQLNAELGKYSKFISEQSNSALTGFYFSTHPSAKWINPLNNLYRARYKIQQLEIANKLGLSTPPTIVTNNKTSLLDFLNTHDAISTKSLDYPNTNIEGQFYPLYNRIINKNEILNEIDNIKHCPTLFQAYIPKKYDIRVIIIGNSINAFAIFSQEQQLSSVDVRGVNPYELKHELINLPIELENNLLQFVKEQGLIFSAIDLLLGQDGKYYFLENNPNGQWLWLELITEFKLSDLLIKELLN